jgi:hypothetical protein
LPSAGGLSALQEIALINKDGTAVTTKTADVAEAALIAVQKGTIPTSSTSDFSGVDLLNLDGDKTWPITLFSYLYLRQDLQHLGHSGGLCSVPSRLPKRKLCCSFLFPCRRHASKREWLTTLNPFASPA